MTDGFSSFWGHSAPGVLGIAKWPWRMGCRQRGSRNITRRLRPARAIFCFVFRSPRRMGWCQPGKEEDNRKTSTRQGLLVGCALSPGGWVGANGVNHITRKLRPARAFCCFCILRFCVLVRTKEVSVDRVLGLAKKLVSAGVAPFDSGSVQDGGEHIPAPVRSGEGPVQALATLDGIFLRFAVTRESQGGDSGGKQSVPAMVLDDVIHLRCHFCVGHFGWFIPDLNGLRAAPRFPEGGAAFLCVLIECGPLVLRAVFGKANRS